MLQLVLAVLLLAEAARLGASSPLRDGGAASPEDEVTEAVKYRDSNPETLEELLTKDHAVLEGDLVLSSDRNAVGKAWPTRVIPYTISPELADRTSVIVAALRMLSENTCLSFPKRTSETNYLEFETSDGCASYVGFMGGKQSMFIGPTCIMGNIVHETLHALGFHHEHTRMDREQYVQVLTNNIMAGKEKNFKMLPGSTFDLPYDVKSILHYGSAFFSANGLPTIVANVDATDMGQRTRLTETDVKRVTHLYKCDSSRDESAAALDGKNRTEEEQTPASSSPVTLQQLNGTTRGQNGTSGGKDRSYQ